MAEIKFACAQCGQHISGDEQWAGHQIQCPTCGAALTVPQAPRPPTAATVAPKSLVPQPPPANRSGLSAGSTQVARSTAPGSIPIRQLVTRPPRRGSPLVKSAIYAVVLAALGGAGYLYVPWLMKRMQDSSNSAPPPSSTPAATSSGSGPLGEVNGAMDISDTLDSGSSSRPRPAARQPAPARATAAPAANPAPGATNDAARARSRQLRKADPAGAGRP
jgi:hypothetical protein